MLNIVFNLGTCMTYMYMHIALLKITNKLTNKLDKFLYYMKFCFHVKPSDFHCNAVADPVGVQQVPPSPPPPPPKFDKLSFS